MNKFILKVFVTIFFILFFAAELNASDICEKEEKYSQTWYYNNCDGNILQSTDQKPIKSHLKQNPNVGYPYNSDEIPEGANPDYKIQIPIAIRQSLPAYGNEIILMMKGTSLASTVTLMDLTGVAKYIISTTFKPIEVFIVAGSIYLFMTFVIHNVIKFLEKKYGFSS